jgi:hypothetical protein
MLTNTISAGLNNLDARILDHTRRIMMNNRGHLHYQGKHNTQDSLDQHDQTNTLDICLHTIIRNWTEIGDITSQIKTIMLILSTLQINQEQHTFQLNHIGTQLQQLNTHLTKITETSIPVQPIPTPTTFKYIFPNAPQAQSVLQKARGLQQRKDSAASKQILVISQAKALKDAQAIILAQNGQGYQARLKQLNKNAEEALTYNAVNFPNFK